MNSSPIFLLTPQPSLESGLLASAREHLASRLEPRSNDIGVLSEYEHDFPGYCRDVLGAQLWEVEEEIGNSVDQNPRTAVAGCHASGKTYVAGAIANWWLDTREPALIINTAPVGRQAQLGVFREARRARRAARIKLPGKVMTREIRISDDRFAIAFSSDNPDAIQGLRMARNVLAIGDEAPGIPDDVIEALQTILTDPSSRFLLQGNPTSQRGAFFDAFHGQKHLWWTRNISAFDSPNVQQKKIIIDGLVSHDFVELKRAQWGIESPQWAQRVLGQFYILAGAAKVIAGNHIEAARQRKRKIVANPKRTMGVDIAASEAGDATSIYQMVHRHIAHVATYHMDNLIDNASKIVQLAVKLEIDQLNVDATGVGKGCFQQIEKLKQKGLLRRQVNGMWKDISLQGVQLGEGAKDRSFRKRLSEVQWAMRNAFDPNCVGADPVSIDPNDTELAEQLSWREWELIDGVICVETKNKLRKRTGKSPDRADAVMLLFVPDRNFVVRSV